jgi:hypothetical protein
LHSFEEAIDRIRTIAPRISHEPLVGARYAPDASASPTHCFSNAQHKAQQARGTVLYGWMFQARELTALPGRGCILAVNHAVWLAPHKKPIDVTPFHSDPKHHPLVVNGDSVLFLVDRAATPLSNEHIGLPLPSWFFPLSDDARVTEHVTGLASKELVEWEKRVAETEGLRGSQRAVDLLRSRRVGPDIFSLRPSGRG